MSIKGVSSKLYCGTLFLFSNLIILANFFANWVLIKCPGLLAITFPLILIPTRAKSPITSNSLCLAASLAQCKVRLSRMPFGFMAISSLLNAFFSFSIVLSDNSLSTYTIALFKSPPLIRSFSKSISISCKKLKVLAAAISSLKSEILARLAFCVPNILVPKSTMVVT